MLIIRNMKLFENTAFPIILGITVMLMGIPAAAGAQSPSSNERDPIEDAYAETERLVELLDLDPAQAFYVDSTLQYNLTSMYAELENARSSGLTSRNTMESIQNKWLDATIASFSRFLDEDQMKTYLYRAGRAKDVKAKEKAVKKKESRKQRKQERS